MNIVKIKMNNKGIALRIVRTKQDRKAVNYHDIYAQRDHKDNVTATVMNFSQGFDKEYEHPGSIQNSTFAKDWNSTEEFVFYVMSVIKSHNYHLVDIDIIGYKQQKPVFRRYSMEVKNRHKSTVIYEKIEALLRSYYDPDCFLDEAEAYEETANGLLENVNQGEKTIRDLAELQETMMDRLEVMSSVSTHNPGKTKMKGTLGRIMSVLGKR